MEHSSFLIEEYKKIIIKQENDIQLLTQELSELRANENKRKKKKKKEL